MQRPEPAWQSTSNRLGRAALDRLRLYLRLAHRWRWLSAGQYEHVSRIVPEIGRLLGGWMRQTRRVGVAAFIIDLPLIGTEKVISERWGGHF